MPKITDKPLIHFHLRLEQEDHELLKRIYGDFEMSKAIRVLVHDFCEKVRRELAQGTAA